MPTLPTQLALFDQSRELRSLPEQVPIDVSFPEEQANELARLESYNKNLFRPNTYLHKWWARRSGTTFRFIMKSLVPEKHLNDYYAPGGLEGVTILDPMMGGGTTLHEAIRLGANVIGYDLDPIPVLQVRASLSGIPLDEKEAVFRAFLGALERKIARYFRTRCPACGEGAEVQFTLYGARGTCPCGEALVLDSFVLREEPDGSQKRIEDFYPDLVVKRGRRCWRLFAKGDTRCTACGESLDNNTEMLFADRYVPLVTAGLCPTHGKFFKVTDPYDLEVIAKAKRAASGGRLPDKEALRVIGGPKSGDLLNKKIGSYADLFSPRQLLYLSRSKSLLDKTDSKHRIWLALLISTSLEFNSVLCGYKGVEKRRPGAIRHVFSHHAYSFPYTSLESNPVFSQRTSGTLRRLFEDRIKDAGHWAVTPVERKPAQGGWRKVAIRGEADCGTECRSIEAFAGQTRRFLVEQRDSSHMPLPTGSVDFVVTDPPYFDSVQYSNLSHFFRVWLRWFLPAEADWAFAESTSAVAESEANAAKYRAVMKAILAEANRVLRRPHGRLIFTFHHWRAEAWIHLTLALKEAGFRLVNSYTVHSENPISVHIRQLKALKHDSILVFQPNEVPPVSGRFPPVQQVDQKDSFQFCRDCASLLGFCLESELADSEIEGLWRDSLGT